MKVSRRDFLRGLGAGALGGALASSPLTSALAGPAFVKGLSHRTQKVVVVQFGGATRFSELFGDPSYRYTPFLRELVKRGMMYRELWNRGLTHHVAGTSNILTGNWIMLEDFSYKPPPAPTIFEAFRRQKDAPKTSTWLIPQGANFAPINRSSSPDYGDRFAAANVWGDLAANPVLREVLYELEKQPEQDVRKLVEAQLNRYVKEVNRDPRTRRLYQERVDRAVEMVESLDPELRRFLLSLDRSKVRQAAGRDRANVALAIEAMQKFAPEILHVNLAAPDVAHQGYWSLYVRAIRDTDENLRLIWEAIQNLPQYQGKTTLLVLPECGRNLDWVANGFQHHSLGDEGTRHCGMLIVGPETRPGVVIEREVQHIDVAPTIAHLLGIELPTAKGKVLAEYL